MDTSLKTTPPPNAVAMNSRAPLTIIEVETSQNNIQSLRSDHNILFGAFSGEDADLTDKFISFQGRFDGFEARLNALGEWIEKRNRRAERGRLPQQGHFDWEYQKYDGLLKDFDDIVEEIDEFRVELEGQGFHKYVVDVQFRVIGNQPPGGNGSIVKNKARSRPSTYPAELTSSTAGSYTPTSSDRIVESAMSVASTQASSMATSPEKRVNSSHPASSRPHMEGLTPLKMKIRTPDKLTLDKQSSCRAARSELQFKIYDPASIKPKTATTAPSELEFSRIQPAQGQSKISAVSPLEKSINPFKPTSNKPKPSTTAPPQPEKKIKQAKRPNPDTNKSTAEYETTSQLLDKILTLNEENAELQKENAALKKAVRVRSTTNRGLEGELAEAKARLERKVREFAERGLSDSEEEIKAKGGLGRNKRRRV